MTTKHHLTWMQAIFIALLVLVAETIILVTVLLLEAPFVQSW